MKTEKTKHYPELDSNPSFPALEKDVLAFWQSTCAFEASVSNRPAQKNGANNEFIFYDGPPFANGLPHYGHLLTGFVKDVFARYQTMQGKRVERRFGWDCHGLPAEMGAEKELGISGRAAIQNFGIDKFNAHCRESVMKYAHEWDHYVTRQARWVDFANDYKTMDTPYMESVLWAFAELYKKGLVYEAYRVMPYSWAAETPLSNFETKLDNSYREREDKAITVAFELKEAPKGAPKADKYYILAWTTTPWTLPSNLALAVGKELKYIATEAVDGICYIFAEKAFASIAQELSKERSLNWVWKNLNGEIISAHEGKFKVGREPKDFEENFWKKFNLSDDEKASEKHLGSHIRGNHIKLEHNSLIGLSYHPLFPYFSDHPNAFRILDGSDFVTDGDGTGIVHMAPGFGEDDQKACEKNNIKLVVPVDGSGRYTDEIFDLPNLSLRGLNVIAQTEGQSADEPFKPEQVKKFGLANLRIIKWLKDRGQLIKDESFKHNYPHCWRTDQPLIYRALPSWYVAVTKFRDRAVELNQEINWIPAHIKDGQMGHMLATAPDWSISRNRFWGTPIPVWRGDKGGIKVFGSIAELEAFFEVKVPDLHRPFIDSLVKKDAQGETWKRVEDVFDCWFESGSMPFAQVHYPFENKDWFETHFPADFITEYVGQTRGWFNTLIMLSTALFDKPPFKNCICHGVVLDAETGLKYSKRLKNYKDPLEVIDAYGADALRWLMIASPVMRGQDLMVDPDGKFIRDVVRLAIKPIWNAYNFFCLYANADGVKAAEAQHSEHLMDRYILAKCAEAVAKIEAALDAYSTPDACDAMMDFFEVLNNWYIRRSKERFWKEECDADKQAAYDTLYTVLTLMCRAAAALLPLTMEAIYRGLSGTTQSVHLADFPAVAQGESDAQLTAQMDRVRDVCNAALAVRNTANIRVRQPLATLTVVSKTPIALEKVANIIEEEINVKRVEFSSAFDAMASLKLQINFPILGKRRPDKVKTITPAAKKGEWKQLADGRIEIVGEVIERDEFTLLLEPKTEYKDRAAPLSTNDALVVLDTTITPELEAEGIARDVVRMVQETRKKAGLHVSDRIQLVIEAPGAVQQAVEAHKPYISDQTLASTLSFGNARASAFHAEQQLDDAALIIGLTKAA